MPPCTAVLAVAWLLATAVAVQAADNTTAVQRCELRCDNLFSLSFLPNMRTGCLAACAAADTLTNELPSAADCLRSCLVRFSPNSGATLDERGGCTTGCALNTVDHDDAQLAAAAASIRAEEATRAAAEAHALNKTVEGILRREDARAAAEEEQLNMSLAALKEAEDERAADEEKALKESLQDVAAAEEARAAQEEEQLRAAIDAERAFEDERAEVEAKRARQQAQKEKKRLDSVQAELTSDMDVLRSEVSALKDALAEQALLLTKTADTIRAEEDARADVEAEALRTSVAELTAHEDARAKAERGMRQDLAESIEELKEEMERQLSTVATVRPRPTDTTRPTKQPPNTRPTNQSPCPEARTCRCKPPATAVYTKDSRGCEVDCRCIG